MARNPNVTKMKKQKFRKHRGAFKPHSDPSTLDPGYNNPALQKFWAERVNVGRYSKAGAHPDALRAAGHTSSGRTVADPWLDAIFPGVYRLSAERERVGQLILALMNATTQVENHFVMWRTKCAKLMLYFNPTKDCWWFVLQERMTLKTSITYGSKQRAQAVCEMNNISWKAVRAFPVNSS